MERLPAVKPFGQVIKGAVRRFNAHDMSTYAYALAFQAFFSVFPFLIFLIALLGFIGVPQFFNWLKEQVTLLVPQQAVDPIITVIEQIQSPNAGLLSMGMAVALWGASGGIRAVMTAINVAYGVTERRPAWLRIPLSLIYTVALAALLIMAAMLFSIGPGAMEWIASLVGLGSGLVTLWTWLRWPLGLVLLSLAVTLVYYAAPNRRQRLRGVMPGAMLSVVVWIIASLGFDFYLSNFANYSAVYGSIGAIIGVLLYFSISASVLLFGAEVNAVMEQGTQQQAHDLGTAQKTGTG